MDAIVEGVARFTQTVYGESQELFERLATGQSPDVLMITCSDSRIDPSLITQTEPGSLFIVRNAGNLVPTFGSDAGGEAASIEYAVAALKVSHVVVCGHDGCGAMGALLDPPPAGALPAVSRWLELAADTRAVVDALAPADTADAATRARHSVEQNVLLQLEHLRTHPSVAAALVGKEGAPKLSLHAWVYDIGFGVVRAYDAKTKCFAPLASRKQ